MRRVTSSQPEKRKKRKAVEKERHGGNEDRRGKENEVRQGEEKEKEMLKGNQEKKRTVRIRAFSIEEEIEVKRRAKKGEAEKEEIEAKARTKANRTEESESGGEEGSQTL